MLAIALSLCAALFYGAADFCGGLASKRVSILAVMLVSQAISFAPLGILCAFVPAHAQTMDYVFGMLAGLCACGGLALLYHALSIGTMGVVSPITAIVGVALPLFAGIVVGNEHLTFIQACGIASALVAVLLISFSTEAGGKVEFTTRGVREALVAGVMFGGTYLFLGYTHASAGPYPLLAARGVSVALLVTIALARRPRIDLRLRANAFALLAIVGTLDVLGNALYMFAARAHHLAIAAVLTSLYPATTVFLARFVLKERLERSQQLGVACALVGVALIAT